MSRSVRIAAALLALSLVVSVPTASAAVRDGDGAGIRERIIQKIKKVLKPLTLVVNDDDQYKPTPPKP